MRQIGDLLVGCALTATLAAIVYFAPKLGQYMSREKQPVHAIAPPGGSLARNRVVARPGVLYTARYSKKNIHRDRLIDASGD